MANLDGMKVPCHFCKVPVDIEAPGTYKRVTGWVKNRTEGGANAVAMPGPATGYACKPCIDMSRTKPVQAESLF
jgi:hypothetical protein